MELGSIAEWVSAIGTIIVTVLISVIQDKTGKGIVIREQKSKGF